MFKDVYTLPILTYFKIIETGNLQLLLSAKRIRFEHAKKIRKVSAYYFWEKIHDELIKEVGVSKDFEAAFHKQRDIYKLELDALLGDQSAYTFIEVYKSDLERIKGHMPKVSNYKRHHAQMLRAVEIHFHRNPRILSTFEFFTDYSDMVKESEEREREMEVIKNGTDG